MINIKKNVANFLSFLILTLATFTANSACILINHQDKESDSVKALRRF